MTDWTAAIGTGTILLRDTGSSAQFHITAGNSIAYDYGLKWSGVVNGVGVGGSYRYEPGMGWRMIGEWGVGYSQTVTFNKDENSGSSGLGGPASVSGYFGRATTPGAPANIGLDQITHTSMRYRFSGTTDGGSAIIRWEYQCSVLSNFSDVGVATSTGSTTRNDLSPGNTYYWRSRGVNGLGNGPWSNTISAKTLPPVWIKVAGTWKKAIPYVKVAGVWKAAVGYVKVAGVWKETT